MPALSQLSSRMIALQLIDNRIATIDSHSQDLCLDVLSGIRSLESWDLAVEARATLAVLREKVDRYQTLTKRECEILGNLSECCTGSQDVATFRGNLRKLAT